MIVAHRVSVIVRTKDKAGTVAATLAAIRAQSVRAEIVVVDSGSTDGTLDLVRRLADVVVEIEPAAYTPGHALNAGAGAASAPVQAAVSAHTTLPRDDWLEAACGHLAAERVGGACGRDTLPDRRTLLRRPYVQEGEQWDASWGFTNTASAWRREVWERHPFHEAMRACEDLEWAWRVLADGWRIVVDPALAVHAGHRRGAGLRALLRREALEQRELCRHTPAEPAPARELLREWWGDLPPNSRWPRPLRRLNPQRVTEYAGRWAGGQQARRRGSAPRGAP